MVAAGKSCITSLAADRASAAADLRTVSPKTRNGGFRQHPLSRFSRRCRGRSMFSPRSRGYCYQTLVGRAAWLNRDPMEEQGGLNLYTFVYVNPIDRVDPLGFDGLVIGFNPVLPINFQLPSTPGFGPPPAPIQVSPSAPGGPGSGDTTAGGAAGGAGISGGLFNAGSKNGAWNQAYDACSKKQHSNSGTCFCCMMTLTRLQNGPGPVYYYTGGYGMVVGRPCSEVQNNPPSVLVPITTVQESSENQYVPW